jgi:hypothetical protein
MTRAIHAFALLAAAACGGRQTDNVDAQAVDASYDLDAHWGECCNTTLGGLGRACTPQEIEAGVGEQYQCPQTMYCGLQIDPYGDPPTVTCCGTRQPSTPYAQVDVGCPPWPSANKVSWGECCYSAPRDAATAPYGGSPGTCPADASTPHVQCSANQYCGLPADDGGGPTTPQRCCGDRTMDKGTLDASGLDPQCMPQYWSL